MRKRSRIQSLSLCVGGLMVTGAASQLFAQNVTGSLSSTQVSYGPNVPGTGALSTQMINTGFGNSTFTGTDGNGQPDANGSELDAAYGTVSNGYLYIFLSGNLENNGNLVNLFIDDGRSGGQNVLDAPNGAGSMQNMNGSVFSPGFNATYALEINDYGPNSTTYMDQFNLLPGGKASYVGSIGMTNGTGSGQNLQDSGIKFGLNNTHISTMGTSGAAADQTAAQSVSTGIEIGIPLSLLGNPTGNIEFLADINGAGGANTPPDDYLSNQFLPGLPVGTGNLGDGTEAYSVPGSPGAFNLSSLSNFWVTVPNTVLSNGIWLPSGGGSWGTGTSWSNGYIPHVAGDSTAFSSASAPSTITLDGNRTVGSISFNDEANGYTIAQGTGGGSLTLDNGGSSATASVTDTAGTHTISAPVVLNSNAALSVLSNGDDLIISGNISGGGGITVSSLGFNGRLDTNSNVVLSGNNSYGGGTTVLKGALQLGSSTALPTGTALTLDATDSPEGSLDLNGFNATVSNIIANVGSGGNTQIINTSTAAVTATLTYAGSNANPTTYPGVISDSSATGGSATALTVASGSLTLNATNTYGGTTTINNGAYLDLSYTNSMAAGNSVSLPANGNVVNNGTLEISNPAIVAGNISGSGTTTVDAIMMLTANGFTQASLVNNGFVQINGNGTVGPISGAGVLSIGDGTDVNTLQLAKNSGLSTQVSVVINGPSQLDITNNHVIIDYSGSPDPMSTIYGYLKSGFNNGSWNGPGIISSQIPIANANSNAPQYGIGFSDGADEINGHPIVSGLSSGQIELKYTLLGDANLDGTVNGADFSILAANFGQGYTNWDQGNFLFTPAVNGADFSALAHNFGQGDSGADVSQADLEALDAFAAANNLAMPSFAVVPEPVTGGLVMLSTMGWLIRRKRK
jgi:autotransporter-associated beta strand protein